MDEHHHRDMDCRKIVYKVYGDPLNVVSLAEQTLPDKLDDEQVLVKMIVAPVINDDIKIIRGFPLKKPPLPATGGVEGIGDVLAVGSCVKNLCPGDRVIADGAVGTWCTSGVFDSKQLKKVSKDINVYALSGISGNPCCAYRILHDFVSLNKNDVIIQNGASSECGQNIIQLAKIFGYISINIIPDQPEPDSKNLVNYLKSLGASIVMTENKFRTTKLFSTYNILKPRLGINHVHGTSSTALLCSLKKGGVMVSYGGFNRLPFIVPFHLLILNDLQLKGFWLNKWLEKNVNTEQYNQMIDELMQYMKDGKLIAPAHKTLPLNSFKEALQNTISSAGFIGHKYFLDLQ